MRTLFVSIVTTFAFTSLAACVAIESDLPEGDESLDSSSQAATALRCPQNWAPAATSMLLCIEGSELVYREFHGTGCIRCEIAREPNHECNGSWKNGLAEFACAPDYEMVFNHDGSCKRCEPARDACNSSCGNGSSCAECKSADGTDFVCLPDGAVC
jgi:hypothetical protein